MNRYFIVYFIATNVRSDTRVTGQIDITSSGSFLIRDQLIRLINKEDELKDIVITGFSELTESDYKDWTKLNK